MLSAAYETGRRRNLERTALVAAAVTVAVDQGSKVAAVALLDGPGWHWGPVTLSVTRNDGGPFGVLPGSSALWVVLATVVLMLAAATLRRASGSILSAALVGTMIGGGVGNLVDRLTRAPGPGRGGVVDWIVVAPYSKVFNLADVAIRGAAMVLLITLIAEALAARPHRSSGCQESTRDRNGFPCNDRR